VKAKAKTTKAERLLLSKPRVRAGEQKGYVITGQQLLAARSMLGWSQAELAKKAHVSVGTIRRIELYPGKVINCHAASLLGVIEILKSGGAIFTEGGVQVAQIVDKELKGDTSCAQGRARRRYGDRSDCRRHAARCG
jgi:Helix-turn-helix